MTPLLSPDNYMRFPIGSHGPIIDASNTNPIRNDGVLQALRAVALVAKCTEGSSFVDRDYDTHRRLAGEAGIPFGGYLFLHPGSPGNEAELFLEHGTPAKGDLQPWIDAEVRDGASFQTVAARVDSCATVLERHGLRPLLYSYTGFLQGLLAARPTLRRLRIIQAAYTRVRPRVGHGSTVVGWQYTDALPVHAPAGAISGSGHYDATRLFVPLDELLIGSSL